MPDAERARKIITCVRGARLAWPTLTAAASENAEAWLGRAWRCRDAVGDIRDYRAVGIAGLRPQATCFPAHRQRRVHHRTLRPALHREKGRSCASALLRRRSRARNEANLRLTPPPPRESRAVGTIPPPATGAACATGESRVFADLGQETSRRVKAGATFGAVAVVARTRCRAKAGVSDCRSRRRRGRRYGKTRWWRDAGKVRSEPKHPSAHQSGSADPCRGDSLTVPAAAQKHGGWTDLQLLWAPARRLALQGASCGEGPI